MINGHGQSAIATTLKVSAYMAARADQQFRMVVVIFVFISNLG